MDWKRFLTQRRIPFATSGPNVSHGNVAVKCPLCGKGDPSTHLSINLKTGFWRCFRNPIHHRGKSNAKLIMLLLNCSFEEASRLAGYSTTNVTNTKSQVLALLKPEEPAPRPPLKMPEEFKAFTGLPSSMPFVDYLIERGFTGHEISLLTDRYDVRYCTRGPYHHRIIFPIYFEDKLVGWTGRTIGKHVEQRYKTLSDKPEKAKFEGYPPAPKQNTHYLLWYDDLIRSDADTIYLEEGPFDALKTRVLGRSIGVEATCFFTAAPSEAQLDLLAELLPNFKHRYLLLDAKTEGIALDVSRQLIAFGVKVRTLPKGVKDPGLLTERHVDFLKGGG